MKELTKDYEKQVSEIKTHFDNFWGIQTELDRDLFSLAADDEVDEDVTGVSGSHSHPKPV